MQKNAFGASCSGRHLSAVRHISHASITTCTPLRQQIVSRTNVLDVSAGRRAAKIAARKGKADANKAKVYAKMGKKIVQLAKAGGPDPVSNAKLDTLIKQAKELGVPKDIIERNIKRATDTKQADYLELFYEVYGYGGTGFVIDCLTDNVNRSSSDVKSILNKAGLKIADAGSVLFNFSRVGCVVVDNSSEDAVFEAAMEAGADDVSPLPEDEDGNPSTSFRVFTSIDQFSATSQKLASLGFKVNKEESELIFRAAAHVEVDDEAFHKCEAVMEKLLELDDVDAVYTNCEGLSI